MAAESWPMKGSSALESVGLRGRSLGVFYGFLILAVLHGDYSRGYQNPYKGL